MSFFTLGAINRVGIENQLVKLNTLIDWSLIAPILKGLFKYEINGKGGQKPYNSLCMFKAILLGQWHNLSDPALEEALRIRLDFILFTGLESPEEVPDETTLCRFRNILIEKGLDESLFQAINRQLENLGLKIEKAHGAVVDATILQSAARPRRTVENPEQDRNEIEKPSCSKMEYSADKDASWLVKGKKFYFGYKGFVIADSEKGYIHKVCVTSANVSECRQLPSLLKEITNKRVYADKGYCSLENREFLKNKSLKDGIMHKATRGKNLKYSQKLFNRQVSKKRFIVEQAFGTLKRLFHFSRASYFSRIKVETQMKFKVICFNLLKAINEVNLVPKS